MDSLQSELVLDPSMGRDDYRTSLINCYFYKYYLHVIDVNQPGEFFFFFLSLFLLLKKPKPGTLPSDLLTAAEPYIRPVSTGEENYDNDPLDYILPQFVPKLEVLFLFFFFFCFCAFKFCLCIFIFYFRDLFKLLVRPSITLICPFLPMPFIVLLL